MRLWPFFGLRGGDEPSGVANFVHVKASKILRLGLPLTLSIRSSGPVRSSEFVSSKMSTWRVGHSKRVLKRDSRGGSGSDELKEVFAFKSSILYATAISSSSMTSSHKIGETQCLPNAITVVNWQATPTRSKQIPKSCLDGVHRIGEPRIVHPSVSILAELGNQGVC